MDDKLTIGGAPPVMYGQNVVLGKQGEFGYTVEYDFSDWVEQFGSGSVGWAFKRPRDIASYLLPHEEDGNITQITITETELQFAGYGEVEVFFINSGETDKRISKTYSVLINESIQDVGQAPEPWQSYVDEVHEDAEEVREIKDEIDHLQFRITDEGILEVNI